MQSKPSTASPIQPPLNTPSSNPSLHHAPSDQRKATISRLEKLVMLEGEALRASDKISLRHLSVNKPRDLSDYSLGLFVERQLSRKSQLSNWSIQTISNQSAVDKTSPFIKFMDRSITRLLNKQHKEQNNKSDTISSFSFDLVNDEPNSSLSIPYKESLWIPLSEDCGLIFLKNVAWQEQEILILSRLAETYACALAALNAKKKPAWQKFVQQRGVQMAALSLAVILCWPVSMTTLAPAEVSAKDPQIISAPMNGVIEKIHIAPNSYVKKGDILATYVDTDMRNALALSKEEVSVSEARLNQILLSSFSQSDRKRDIQVSEAELALAQSRRDYAAENSNKMVLKAQADGLLLYSDKDDWAGRPVSIGERIMMIANPKQVQLKIEAPLGDGALLKEGAKIRLFLDSAPLKSIQASLISSNYTPEPMPNNSLAYISTASFTDEITPRIGARGVAKIYGKTVPLAYWLFRKPIVATRQFIGL